MAWAGVEYMIGVVGFEGVETERAGQLGAAWAGECEETCDEDCEKACKIVRAKDLTGIAEGDWVGEREAVWDWAGDCEAVCEKV